MREIKEEDFEAVAKFEIEISEILLTSSSTARN